MTKVVIKIYESKDGNPVLKLVTDKTGFIHQLVKQKVLSTSQKLFYYTDDIYVDEAAIFNLMNFDVVVLKILNPRRKIQLDDDNETKTIQFATFKGLKGTDLLSVDIEMMKNTIWPLLSGIDKLRLIKSMSTSIQIKLIITRQHKYICKVRSQGFALLPTRTYELETEQFDDEFKPYVIKLICSGCKVDRESLNLTGFTHVVKAIFYDCNFGVKNPNFKGQHVTPDVPPFLEPEKWDIAKLKDSLQYLKIVQSMNFKNGVFNTYYNLEEILLLKNLKCFIQCREGHRGSSMWYSEDFITELRIAIPNIRIYNFDRLIKPTPTDKQFFFYDSTNNWGNAHKVMKSLNNTFRYD